MSCLQAARRTEGRPRASSVSAPANYQLFAPDDCVFITGPDCNGDDQWVGFVRQVRVVSDIDRAVTLHGLSPWFPAKSLVYLSKVPCKPLDSPRSRLRSSACNPGPRMERWYKRVARRVLDGIRRRAMLLMLSPGFWLAARVAAAVLAVVVYFALAGCSAKTQVTPGETELTRDVATDAGRSRNVRERIVRITIPGPAAPPAPAPAPAPVPATAQPAPVPSQPQPQPRSIFE